MDDEETQRNGICVIVDLRDVSWKLMKWLTPGNLRVAVRKAEVGPMPGHAMRGPMRTMTQDFFSDDTGQENRVPRGEPERHPERGAEGDTAVPQPRYQRQRKSLGRNPRRPSIAA